MRLCICSQHRVFPLPWWCFPLRMERFREACAALAGAVMVCHSQKEIWRSWFCRRRVPAKEDKQKRRLYVDYGVLQKIFQKMHVVKAAWIRHYGDLTVLNWSRWVKYCSFFVVNPVGYFWLLYFVFSFVLAKLKTWFWFSPQSSSFCNLVGFSR